VRRCHGAELPVRGRRRAAHPGGPLVLAQSLGSQAVETHRLQEGQNRRRPEAGGHPPPHVARWNRLHLVKQGGSGLEATTPREFRESGTDVPVGTAAPARPTEALRCLIEASAFSTLVRQRPPTPSCGGQSPYRGENSEPGRRIKGELDIQPRVREHPRLCVDGPGLARVVLRLIASWSGAAMCPACLCDTAIAGPNAIRGSGPN
jgi:hypothetical protein